MWNQEVNAWALGHLVWGDIMVEAKAKELSILPFINELTIKHISTPILINSIN
jgi:hypothetical protein